MSTETSRQRDAQYGDSDRFEEVVAAFEDRWRSKRPPKINDFIAANVVAPSLANSLVWELVLIDMENRWKGLLDQTLKPNQFVDRPLLSDYVGMYPSLLSAGAMPIYVIAEEYRIRCLWGDRPNHDRFLSKHPEHLVGLLSHLRAVDLQLAVDGQSVDTSTPGRSAFAYDPRASLSYSDFVLERLVGRGGMGRVYRATQRSLNRTVAVKALLKSRQTSPAAVEQFVQEALILAHLDHPNIVKTYGLGQFPGGGYFLVLEFIEGVNLQARLDNGTLDHRAAVDIVREVTKAIDTLTNKAWSIAI